MFHSSMRSHLLFLYIHILLPFILLPTKHSKWVLDSLHAAERKNQPNAYNVTMKARYQFLGKDRWATATGVIRFNRDQNEVRVENYRYNVTGYP